MSSKSTVVWLLVAVVLGVAAVLLLRTSGTGNGSPGATLAVGDRVLHVDQTRLESIRILHADGSAELLERAASGGAEWVMQVAPAGLVAADAAKRPAWPVPTSRVQALVRQLNDVQVRATAGSDASLGARPTTVTINTEGSPPIVVKLADQSVAGKALVEVTEPASGAPTGSGGPVGEKERTVRAIVDDTIHLLFRNNAAREWRDRTALFGAGLDASRIRLENSKGTKLSLGKVMGEWSVREPWSAPADPAAVQRLLSAVTSIQIVDFLDQGVQAASTQLDKPAATLTLETDRHEPETTSGRPGATVADKRTLDIGGAADSAGSRLFAKVDGERTVVIDARAVADLKLDPALYARPFPTRLNAADIGTIAIERTAPDAAVPGSVYRRELERWKQVRPDGQEVLLPDADTRPVIALLGFICGPASGVAPTPSAGGPPLGPTAIAGEAPENLRPLGRIKILSLSGAPLNTLEVGSARPGTITVRTDSVYRTFALDRVPSLIGEFAQTVHPAPAKDANGVPLDLGK